MAKITTNINTGDLGTNLSLSQTSNNFTINSDTGTDASVPLGNGSLAGATLNNYTTTEKNKLAAITGTNTGDQDLQQVTDLGANTTNTITIQSTNSYGLTAEVAGTYPAVYADNALSGNGVEGYANTGVGVNAYSQQGVGLRAESVSGKSIIVFGNGSGTPSVEVNLGNTNKGLVINSGASSTGNFIELDKNGVDKLTVNQQGTLTINTINADGLNINTSGADSTKSAMTLTSTISDGTTFSCYSYNGSLGSYIYSDSGDCLALQNDFLNGTGLNISSTGAGITAYSIAYPVIELNQALTNKGLVINSGTSSTGNFIELAKNSVNKLTVNQEGELTAQKLIKDGGTSSQILAADGSVITAGTNITITGGTISSVGGTGGGGSSVNYYLNGGTSQGTFGGTTYYEFSKTAVIGTGADFNISSNGYIASFITDVADPSLLLIPGGNWNLEFFFSSSSAGGSPSFYVELYKYDGTTFTLITSNSTNPEGITGGTSIDAYFTPLAVPETVLTVNDRLAIRVFVNASSKTITLHTQNGHLCEVITTFTSGLTALNGLQAQVQNFATGTTGTDFAIVSSGSTHTFNLPSASQTARGVVTTGTQTFAGSKTFTDNLTAGRYLYSGGSIFPEFGHTFYINGTGTTHYFGGGTSNAQNNLEVSNGTLKIGLQTASTIASFDANKNVVSLTTANGYPTLTELKSLVGVSTTAIQTQLNGKQPINANLTSISALSTTSGASFVRVYNGGYYLDNGNYLTSVGIANLTATGTPSATTYLRGDNTWSSIPVPSQSAYTVLANNTNASAVPTEQVYKDVAQQTYTATPTWSTSAPTTILANTYEWSQIGSTVNVRISLSYNTGAVNSSVILPMPADMPAPASITGFTGALDILAYGSGMMVNATNQNPPAVTGARNCLLRRNAANNGYEFFVNVSITVTTKVVIVNLTYFA